MTPPNLATLIAAVATAFAPGTHGVTHARLTLIVSGHGAVVVAPSGLRCSVSCSRVVRRGARLTLTAHPEHGSRFAGWKGACSGVGRCRFKTSVARSVNAAFKPSRSTAPTRPLRPLPPLPNPKPAASVMFNCTDAPASMRQPVYARLAAAGVSWVRINYEWVYMEAQGPGSYDQDWLTRLDDCVQKAQAAGIKVLVALTGTPPWAASGPNWNSPPKNPADFAHVISFLAQRYAGRVGAWEVWNEENTGFFWSGSAADYVALLKASYPAIKQADPNALVVFGGTAYNDDAWIAATYAAGAKGFFDVMATHPYPSHLDEAPETADDGTIGKFTHIAAVHQVMLDNRDNSPIWFTESGWSAPTYVSLATQADYLTREYNYTRANYPYVTNVFWFEAANQVRDVTGDSWQGGLSLLNPDLSARPAYDALKAFATGA